MKLHLTFEVEVDEEGLARWREHLLCPEHTATEALSDEAILAWHWEHLVLSARLLPAPGRGG